MGFLGRARARADIEAEQAVVETSFSLFLAASIISTASAVAGSGFPRAITPERTD